MGETYAQPAAGVADTSAAAAEAISATADRIRELMLQAIRHAGTAGLTADEAADRLRLSVLTARPRCTELRQCGAIVDSGLRRRNRSGRSAIVWVAA